MTDAAPPSPQPQIDRSLPPAKKGEIAAWASFDFANSSFMMVTVTLVFPLYFTNVVVGNDERGNWLWGNISLISMLIVVLGSPFLGALADIHARKKLYLFWTYVTCIVFTLLLVTVGSGDIVPAMAYLIIAIVAYAYGENLVAAFLPEISTPKSMGRISAIGWGCGYVGSFLSLLAFIVFHKFVDSAADFANYLVAGIFLVGGLPTFLFLRERGVPQPVAASSIVVGSWKRVWQTLKTIPQNKALSIFFPAFFLYMCGLNAVTWFFVLYAQQVMGFTQEGLIAVLLVVQVSGAVGAFTSGWLQERFGHRNTIIFSLLVWIAAVLSAFVVTSWEGFFAVASVAGSGLGLTQSPSRTIVGLLAPEERHAEYFGLWGLFGKLSAGVGPWVFGLLNVTFSSPRVAIGVTAVFFIAGMILLFFMPKPEQVDEPASGG
ncbi:MAG: MFS transporter [Verrucomicrobiota bacterium]